MKLSTCTPRVTILLATAFLLALALMGDPSIGTGWPSVEAAAESPEPAFVPGRLLLMPRGPLSDILAGLPADLHVTHENLAGLGVVRLEVPAGHELEIAGRLAANPQVEWVEPDYLRSAMTVPNDPLYRQHQWNLRRIGMEQAWDVTTGSPNVIVAVLDTGVDVSHPDLAGKLLPGYDFLNDDPDPSDDGGHGTHNAGVIAATSNNAMGVTGMAWQVRVLPIKVLNSSGVGPDSAFAKGIAYAVDQGARVINMSFGSPGSSRMLSLAVRYAHNRGVFLVAAAGNTAKLNNSIIYPAAYEQVLAVGATDEEDRVGDFSQHHPYVGVSAPGVGIVSTFWEEGGQGSYASASGTSSAAPHVSALASLLFSVDPTLTNSRVRQIIQSTAEDLGGRGKDNYYGAGRINALKAIQAASPPPATRPTATPAPARATPAPARAIPPAPTPTTLPQTTWYFAEGSTSSPFDLWLLLQNPSYTPATARITYMRTEGPEERQEVLVPPASRKSVFVNEVIPNAELSIKVESDSLILAERAMYFGRDGHDSGGVPEPSRNWYFAEGSTREGFDNWILLQNPQASIATVNLTYVSSEGRKVDLKQILLPNSRRSIYVNPLLPDAEMGTIVTSDQQIIAERAMYFAQGGGHGSFGASQLNREWYLAEGQVGNGFDTWLFALNPNQATTNLKVTYMLEQGGPVEGYYAIPPSGRLSIHANETLPAGRFGTRVEADQPIVVERSSYFASGKGGHNTVGSPTLSQEWYLPEGATSPPFEETVAVLNPSDRTAILAVSFMKAEGSSEVQYFEVKPTSRLTLDVSKLIPEAELSVKVSSDTPVVVERSMYFAQGQGGTSALGVSR